MYTYVFDAHLFLNPFKYKTSSLTGSDTETTVLNWSTSVSDQGFPHGVRMVGGWVSLPNFADGLRKMWDFINSLNPSMDDIRKQTVTLIWLLYFTTSVLSAWLLQKRWGFYRAQPSRPQHMTDKVTQSHSISGGLGNDCFVILNDRTKYQESYWIGSFSTTTFRVQCFDDSTDLVEALPLSNEWYPGGVTD